MDSNTPGIALFDVRLPRSTASRWREIVNMVRAHVTISLTVLAVAILGVVVEWWAFGSGTSVSYVTAPLGRGDVTRAVTATGLLSRAQGGAFRSD